jgi:hypothetical protein
VEVSSSEDDVLNLDASVGKKKMSAGDDTEDGGVYSVEPIAPNLISSSAPERSDLSTTVQVATFVPPNGKCGHKRPLPTTGWNKPLPQVDQVMTQIELPPYHGPRSPMDLVAIEVVFGHIFEVFRHITQATAMGIVATEDDRPQKKPR